jgi:tRNA(Ile)-lysidine synthase
MIRKIKSYIEQNNMLKNGDRIVLGVSGGADSICLLHVLKCMSREYGLSLVIVHVNHGIRGEEAERDENYVRELCRREELEYLSFRYDVRAIADKEGMSEEEAGRKVRYDTFLQVCRTHGCNKIAIAHNRNDNAETVLFHLFRGANLRGLTGIDAVRSLPADFGKITLIRPLLGVTRSEIEAYLSREGITFLTDSTNLKEDYSRNKIRNKILAYAAKEINTRSIDNITEAAGALREVEDYVNYNILSRCESLAKKEGAGYRVRARELGGEHIVIQKGIIRLLLEELSGGKKDLEAKHVDAVLSLLDKQSGKQVHLPYHVAARQEYGDIIIYQRRLSYQSEGDVVKKKLLPMGRNPECLPGFAHPKTGETADSAVTEGKTIAENVLQESILPIKIKIPGRTEIIPGIKYVETELINYKNNLHIPKSSCAKWFDYDKIENAVEVRTRREGDYLQINASGGRKKLKDYFIDHKIPRELRDSRLLIADGTHVMWIVGEEDRMSEKYKVDETTTKILLMKMFDREEKDHGL